MNPIVLVCFLATAAIAVPQGYGSAYGGSSYQSQPSTSQAYSGPSQNYQSQPVSYHTPSITFNPPQIQYSQPSITYSTPSHVPYGMPAQGGSYGGGSSYNNQQPLVLGYQQTGSYGGSSYGMRRRR